MTILTKAVKHIHCIGIGGIGVSGIAEILLAKGYQVSGSDLNPSAILDRLSKLGATIIIGHEASNIEGADVVVYSSAVSEDNPEFQQAQSTGVPLVKRGAMLADLFNVAYGIAVAGTHGKTTTSSILSYVLDANQCEPTFVVGGILNHCGSSAKLGRSNYFIVESDESDASFLYLKPRVVIVTNIDADHMGTYQNDFNILKKAFVDFINSVPNDGLAILCSDDPVIASILPDITAPFMTYGYNSNSDIQIANAEQNGLHIEFDYQDKECSEKVALNMPGRHNALNSVGVIAAAKFLGLDYERVFSALAKFPGVGRRFNVHGEIKAGDGYALLFDDYGHHPSEIKTTLAAAQSAWPDRRIVLVFQPHRYTRTKDLMSDFAAVLADAQVLILLDIYAASELPINGITGEALSKEVALQNKVTPFYVSQLEDLPERLKLILHPNDIVLFQGAGSVGPYAATVKKLLSD